MCVPPYPTKQKSEEDGLTEPLLKNQKTITVNGKELKKRKKKKQKKNVGKEIFKANPLATLGFGITAYVDILWTMSLFFIFASALMWPTLQFYKSGSGYDSVTALIGYENTMIANIGYSST
jgi:hypothetical protein